MPGTFPDSFSSTMRTKFGGVGGRLEVTRSTNPDSDASHADNQPATAIQPVHRSMSRLIDSESSLATMMSA